MATARARSSSLSEPFDTPIWRIFVNLVGIGPNVEEAAEDAARRAVDFAVARTGLSREETYMLVSIIGELCVGTLPRPMIAGRLIVPEELSALPAERRRFLGPGLGGGRPLPSPGVVRLGTRSCRSFLVRPDQILPPVGRLSQTLVSSGPPLPLARFGRFARDPRTGNPPA